MNDDEKIDAYLIDPAAPPDDQVRELEQTLAPLRYEPAARPQFLDRRGRRGWRRLLAVAALVAFLMAGASFWFWTWPSDRPWRVVAGPIESLRVGERVSVGSNSSLLVRVARIGWMRVGRDSELTLVSTRSNHHRLALAEGTLHVSIWAPPWSLAVGTPSGEVIDFGCEFILRADDSVTSVDVVSGWVRVSNASGEVLVPGGASSIMTASGLASVPLFRSATEPFRTAVRALETSSGPTDRALETVLRDARRRDVLTLLLLAKRMPLQSNALLGRAAELMPPASRQTFLRARLGDDEAVEAWIGELPLPPRNWVPNWRDRLPFAR